MENAVRWRTDVDCRKIVEAILEQQGCMGLSQVTQCPG